jgi:hypothetical protein
VQWNCVPQNLNLQGNRERVTTGPVATYEKSRGRQIGKTFKTTKANQLQFLDNDAAKQQKLG